jgi:altronate hydrolase
MDNNPTPGNKKGGLSTILEKSLGAVAKGGTSRLMDVYEYAEPVTTKGLVFMDTPGYDPCSITGFVAGGANVVCFTTGRGSVYGCKPVKVDMDIICCVIADGHKSIGETGDEIFRMILETASGRYTRSEIHGIGDLEFVPWQISAVL